MDYGARIKDLIGDNDMTQKALAKEFGLTQSVISNYVTQRTVLPPEALAQIAEYFSVTTDYILGLTETRHPPFAVSDAERKLLSDFRTLSQEQKELIAQNVLLMKKQNERG